MNLSARAPGGLWRTLLSNVFLLSAVYLVVGLGLELIRKAFDAAWAARLLTAMDGLPSRTLQVFGLLTPLREAYGRGAIDTWELRAIFSLATLGVIVITAVAVGLFLALLDRLFSRRTAS